MEEWCRDIEAAQTEYCLYFELYWNQNFGYYYIIYYHNMITQNFILLVFFGCKHVYTYTPSFRKNENLNFFMRLYLDVNTYTRKHPNSLNFSAISIYIIYYHNRLVNLCPWFQNIGQRPKIYSSWPDLDFDVKMQVGSRTVRISDIFRLDFFIIILLIRVMPLFPVCSPIQFIRITKTMLLDNHFPTLYNVIF